VGKKASLKRLHFCNFKLNALLEVTNAINDDLSSEDLLSKFEQLLIKELNIGKIVIFASIPEWTITLESGGKVENFEVINVQKDLLSLEEITTTSSTENPNLSSYDFIIPVFHDTRPLAYVLIGDVDEEKEGVSPTIKHLSFIQTLTNVIFVALENKKLLRENIKQEGMRKELELATKMQTMLIPNAENFPKNDYISIETFYLPHFEVGGDYYDFVQISEDELFFCIADVSGKGISAAILMSNFQASLKASLKAGVDLTELVTKLNERVIESAQGEKFITFFAAKYNYKTRELRYVNAGHNPPFLYFAKSKELKLLKEGCPGMGMLDDLPPVKEGVIQVKKSAKIICYTDGLAELEYEGKEEGGLDALEVCLSDKLPVSYAFERIIRTLGLEKSNTALFDDITLLGIDFLSKS